MATTSTIVSGSGKGKGKSGGKSGACPTCGQEDHRSHNCPHRGFKEMSSAFENLGTRNAPGHLDDDGAKSTSTGSGSDATSKISIDPGEHCTKRQQERKVTDHEIKRAVKHGAPLPDPQGNPGRIKKTSEDVTVITQGKRIVTVWRESVITSKPRLSALQEEREEERLEELAQYF